MDINEAKKKEVELVAKGAKLEKALAEADTYEEQQTALKALRKNDRALDRLVNLIEREMEMSERAEERKNMDNVRLKEEIGGKQEPDEEKDTLICPECGGDVDEIGKNLYKCVQCKEILEDDGK